MTDSKYKMRLVGSGMMKVNEIKKNPNNWRMHPKYQSVAMEGVLEEIGWTERLMVNKTTGNLVNGHMRLEVAIQNGEEEVPVDFVELTEEEEKLALATHDPLAMMAVTDRKKHQSLLDNIDDESGKLAKLLEMYKEKESSFGSEVNLIEDMELIAFEGYDYIVLVFRNQLDWVSALDLLKIKKVRIPVNAQGQEKIGLGRVVEGTKILELIRR